MGQKNMPTWESLPNQVGSTKMDTPEVETAIQGTLKKSFCIGGGIVSIVSLLWHFAIPTRLTGGSTLAYFAAIFAHWMGIGWIIREIGWTQHKYDADQYVNMCISFHVDIFCIFILLCVFTFFTISNSCQNPIMCLPTCLGACAAQGSRCFMFTFGMGGKTKATDEQIAAAEGRASKKAESQKVEKEVETEEAYKKRKMINAGCAAGILGLAGLSFFVPQLSFAISLAICVGLPFFRAAQNKEEDTSNV